MIYLTGHNYTARETIQNIFSPLIGVISSPLAEEICQRNNLGFVELLQPFAKLTTDAVFRDVTGTSVSMRGLRLNFYDIDFRTPQTMLARKMLNEAVTNACTDNIKVVKKANLELELPKTEPWFEGWRDTFLSVQFPEEHEFTRHLLSCLIVLSSSDPNIIETATKLTQQLKQMQSVTPQKLPKWFQPDAVLNSYVLLHEDYQGDLSNLQQRYDLLKSNFSESHCFLIQLNSGNTNEVIDYWSTYIKRQPKCDAQLANDKDNISTPNMKWPIDNDTTELDITILHPLSPEMTQDVETFRNISLSSESLMQLNADYNEFNSDSKFGVVLNASDIENLRHFVQDYAVRALIPYAERLVANLNEAITNKKGVSKSLLSATKRWFITSKPGLGTNNQNAVIYTYESAELQTRRLGDLYFMFGHYNLAFQAYHQAKRDFNAESAWQYYAGALEMAALSAFMLGTANRKTYDYMENAIVCYLTVCKLQQLAIRATLLSIECLKSAGLYSEAAKQLIRMTSEESDLRSALLLEQAAYCYLACHPTMYRKYAFHIVLAGNRYSRAGQRSHAYRCYRQAFQVFQHHNWRLAEDHIQYTMGKHAYALKRLEEATCCYSQLLRCGSQQSAQQILIFLKEYIQTQNEYIARTPNVGLLIHATPLLIRDSVRVLVTSNACKPYPLPVSATNIDIESDLNQEPLWHKLEEMIVITAADNRPVLFKPTHYLFTQQNSSTEYPLAVRNEMITLSVKLVNTMKCRIVLNAVELLWKLRLDDETELTNMCLFDDTLNADNETKTRIAAVVESIVISSVNLEEQQKQTVCFSIKPKITGQLSILGAIATVIIAAEPQFKLLGALYFQINDPHIPVNFQNMLNFRTLPSLPVLNVSFSQLPQELLAGEIVGGELCLANMGTVPIETIYIASDGPRWFTFQDSQIGASDEQLPVLYDIPQEKAMRDKEIRRKHVRVLLKPDDEVLKPQDMLNIQFCIQAPYNTGEFTLRLLFYYAIPTSTNQMCLKYRLVRHTWHFNVENSLKAYVSNALANCLTGERSLDMNLQNINPTADIYLESMDLYSNQYALDTYKFHKSLLRPGKSLVCQSRLQTRSNLKCKKKLADEANNWIEQRLSKHKLTPTEQVNSARNILTPNILYSFLMKHERYDLFYNEDLATNRISSHTVILKWNTNMTSCHSNTREVHGVHFLRMKDDLDKTPSKLSDFHIDDDDDIWEQNSEFNSQRCLLEDENYLIALTR